MSKSPKYDAGLKNRREVLGAEYVDKAISNVDSFNAEFQELVTQYCWGEIWSREGLSRRERSLINLGMISALNRPHELKLHVQGALNNGLSPDEIKEVLLQVMVYCGVPAAVEGFRVAREVVGQNKKRYCHAVSNSMDGTRPGQPVCLSGWNVALVRGRRVCDGRCPSAAWSVVALVLMGGQNL
jgi:4-carboxymuconolactone decarboxylase